MSEVPSIVGAMFHGVIISESMRMTLLSFTAFCRLLPRLAGLPSYRTRGLLQPWLFGGIGTRLEFVCMEEFLSLPAEPADALHLLVSTRAAAWDIAGDE